MSKTKLDIHLYFPGVFLIYLQEIVRLFSHVDNLLIDLKSTLHSLLVVLIPPTDYRLTHAPPPHMHVCLSIAIIGHWRKMQSSSENFSSLFIKQQNFFLHSLLSFTLINIVLDSPVFWINYWWCNSFELIMIN